MTEQVSDIILLTIRSLHASRIYSGAKTIELRKTFPNHATKIAFLYEPKPLQAVTGAFFIQDASRMSKGEILRRVKEGGVQRHRASRYLGNRSDGWLVKIAQATRFLQPISLSELQSLNHYFAPPQVFRYLDRNEGVTQALLGHLNGSLVSAIRLRPLQEFRRSTFAAMVQATVKFSYADIDEDFIQQLLVPSKSEDAAFSTVKKEVLEVVSNGLLLGFTVLTHKSFGAIKSGPTMLREEVRGMGIGQAVRERILAYCNDLGIRKVYCTCADTAPSVVGYLLRSGMGLEARLKRHLAKDRDELVFGLPVRDGIGPSRIPKDLNASCRSIGSVGVLNLTDNRFTRSIDYFVSQLHKWYFKPLAGFRSGIIQGLRRFEDGVTAYSAKARIISAAFNQKGRPIAVVLATFKRSGMMKLNIVSDVEDYRAIGSTVLSLIKTNHATRRFYTTIPIARASTIKELLRLGFSGEGLLRSPFINGVDHLCLGLNREI